MRKKLLLALVGSLIMAMMFGGVASAHVHAVTPLLQISVDNPNSGGNGTNGTPADDINGGPLVNGPIPIVVGNSTLAKFEGGWGATRGHYGRKRLVPREGRSGHLA